MLWVNGHFVAFRGSLVAQILLVVYRSNRRKRIVRRTLGLGGLFSLRVGGSNFRLLRYTRGILWLSVAFWLYTEASAFRLHFGIQVVFRYTSRCPDMQEDLGY